MKTRHCSVAILFLLVLAGVCGCRMAAEKSAGFVNPELMKPSPEETAFRREYAVADYNPSRYRKIYIKPVIFTNQLPNGAVEDTNIRNMMGWKDEDLKELVDYAYVSVRNAFGRDARYKLTEQPGEEDSVNVELALVRVVPGKPIYHGCMLILLPFPIGPALDAGINAMSGGSFNSVCSMECRVLEGKSGQLIIGLADNEKNKLSILNLLNFTAYGNQRQIIDEWAENIVKKMAANPDEKIPEPPNFVIINY